MAKAHNPKREVHVHPESTRRRKLRYFFHPKHHGKGVERNATWCVTRDEEFAVFDFADFQDLSDAGRSLYGASKSEYGLRILGTWEQQIAVFPFSSQKMWHGYPLHPVTGEQVPEKISRRSARFTPPAEVLEKMVRCGLIDEGERIRLEKGEHV